MPHIPEWLEKTLWVVGVYGAMLGCLWLLCVKATNDPDDDNQGDPDA